MSLDSASETEAIAENSRTSNATFNVSTDIDTSLILNKVGHSAPDDNEMFVVTCESGTKKDYYINMKLMSRFF